MTAKEFRREAESLCLWLDERGIEPRDRVVLFALVLKSHFKAYPLTPDEKAKIMGFVQDVLEGLRDEDFRLS